MKFNNFIWETYKNSDNGKKLFSIFSNLEEIYTSKTNEITNILNHFAIEKYTDEQINEHCSIFIIGLIKDIKKSYNTDIRNEDDAFELFNNLWYSIYMKEEKKFIKVVDEKEYEEYNYCFDVDEIGYLSEALFIINKDYYFPYYFIRQFYLLQNIFNEFGIFLPPIPPKKDREKRFFYYWELCKSIKNFREQFNMSNIEFSVFIYGFAINVIKRYEISNNLPEPQKVYIVGGGINNNGDFDYLDNVDQNSFSLWNGNPETQPGDIVLMYCLTPRSSIHSIWQAITPGFVDPFFYFYRCIYIGKPIKITTISLQEIKKDKILSELPLVKGNMQGINGRQIGVKYYNRILEILKQKNDNIDNLPKIKEIEIEEVKIKNEHDVELKLLEPLLEKLGYSKKDWQRQVKVKIGRTERIIPDYVIFPELIKGNEKGYWIWEAKYSIPSHKQLKEDANQAKSYALRFQSKGFSLVSKEGIWISDKNLDINNLKYLTWIQLESNDYFNELFDTLGKKKKM